MTSILRTIMVVVATVGAISFFAPWFEVLDFSSNSAPFSAWDTILRDSALRTHNSTTIPPGSELRAVAVQLGYHVGPTGWIYFAAMIAAIVFSTAWPRLVGLPSALPVWAASTLAFGIMALAVAPNMTFVAWGTFVALTASAIVSLLSSIAFISAWKAAGHALSPSPSTI